MILKAGAPLRSIIMRAGVPKSASASLGESAELLSLIPDWLKEMLEDGSVLFMPPEDYHDLPFEVQQHLEVLKY
jgi:hypothetical protein